MRELKTWNGKKSFKYSGSITSKIDIRYGAENKGHAPLTEVQCKMLIKFINEHKGKEILIDAIINPKKIGGLGKWIYDNITETAIASYIGPILIAEGYAVFTTFPEVNKAIKIKFN